MKYKFPEIRHIDDVRPAIAGRDEFIIAERDFGFVVNYVAATSDTFDMSGPDDTKGAIKRECRGIKFSPNGEIAARPFHKWFNVNEKEETLIRNIDMTKPHFIEEKRDGSMLHPMKVNGEIRWMTKMGITEVAMQAEEFIEKNTRYKDFAAWCIREQLTPIFEWTSPNNKIVITYKEEQLTLLSVRHNITGKYLMLR
jgi:RNA ligase